MAQLNSFAARVSVRKIAHLKWVRLVVGMACAMGSVFMPHFSGVEVKDRLADDKHTWAEQYAVYVLEKTALAQNQTMSDLTTPKETTTTAHTTPTTPKSIAASSTSTRLTTQPPTPFRGQTPLATAKSSVTSEITEANHSVAPVTSMTLTTTPRVLLPEHEAPVDVHCTQTVAATTPWLALNSSPLIPTRSGVEVGISVGPVFVLSDFNAAAAETYTQLVDLEDFSATALRTSQSHVQSAYTGALQLGVSITDNVSLRSGVNYTQVSGTQEIYLRNQMHHSYTIVSIPGAVAGLENSNATFTTTTHSTTYFVDTLYTKLTRKTLTVPLTIRYRLGNHKWRAFIEGGLYATVATSLTGYYQSRMVSNENVNAYTSGLVNANYTLGMGLSYQIREGWHISVNPTYFAPTQNAGIHNAYQRLSLLTGVYWSW